MGPFLTKILMECNQEVPDFLQQFIPEGDVLDFDAEEEPETETFGEEPAAQADAAQDDAWGSGGDAANGHDAAADATDGAGADIWGASDAAGASGAAVAPATTW